MKINEDKGFYVSYWNVPDYKRTKPTNVSFMTRWMANRNFLVKVVKGLRMIYKEYNINHWYYNMFCNHNSPWKQKIGMHRLVWYTFVYPNTSSLKSYNYQKVCQNKCLFKTKLTVNNLWDKHMFSICV